MATALGAQEVIQGTIPMVAGGAINKGDCVKHSTDASGTVIQCTAATDVCIGIALSTVSTGQPVSVQNLGIALVKNKSGVTEGDQAAPTTTAGQPGTLGAGGACIGQFLQTGADGEWVGLLLRVPGVKAIAS